MQSILHVVASVNPSVGGPSQSVPNLLTELSNLNHRCRLICLDYEEHGPLPTMPPGILTPIQPHCFSRALRGWSSTLAQAIDLDANYAAIIHNHGLWMLPNHYAARSALKWEKPYIISPRGMLGTWALANSPIKKRLVWHLREKYNLASAFAFHATSQQEAMHIRLSGFTQPIAIIPNGIEPHPVNPFGRLFLDESLPSIKNKRLALFISRIHPKKGLLELVRAWSSVPEEIRRDWILVLAGPDLTNHRRRVKAEIHATGMDNFIHLHPAVSGPLKQTLMEQAELFVLPSYEENFGIVVAESLAHGTPVITTRNTPWESLNTHDCGWWIPLSVDSLKNTLVTALSLSPEVLSAMGRNGKDYVEDELSWKVIARKMAAFYHWVLKGGTVPDFVQIE